MRLVRLSLVALISLSAIVLGSLWLQRSAEAKAYPADGTQPIGGRIPTRQQNASSIQVNMLDAGQSRYPEDFRPHYDAVVEEIASNMSETDTVDSAARRVVRGRIVSNPGLYCRLLLDNAARFTTDHSARRLHGLLGLDYRPSGLRDRIMRGD